MKQRDRNIIGLGYGYYATCGIEKITDEYTHLPDLLVEVHEIAEVGIGEEIVLWQRFRVIAFVRDGIVFSLLEDIGINKVSPNRST